MAWSCNHKGELRVNSKLYFSFNSLYGIGYETHIMYPT